MVVSLAIEPAASGATHMSDYRFRPAMGERTVLPDGPQKSPASSNTSDRGSGLPFQRGEAPAEVVAEPERTRTSDFAAAVIAGALSPTPESMQELIRRIGSSEIPEESQARLRNLIV